MNFSFLGIDSSWGIPGLVDLAIMQQGSIRVLCKEDTGLARGGSWSNLQSTPSSEYVARTMPWSVLQYGEDIAVCDMLLCKSKSLRWRPSDARM